MPDQTASYPVSKVQLVEARAVVEKKGNSVMASTTVAEVYLTIRALPRPSLASTYWPTLAAENADPLAVRVMLPLTADGVSVTDGVDVASVKA